MTQIFSRRWRFLILAMAWFALWASPSPAVAQTGDVLLVLPFENTAKQSEYNWVGESFADALADLLKVPGLVVISNDERESGYRRMKLPLSSLPSRATAIKMARDSGATLVVVGKYNIIPPQGETPAALQVEAKIVRVNEGRITGRVMPDGHWAYNISDVGGALTQLQNLHGRLAYQLLYQRDNALPYSQSQIIQQATKVPQAAFESYIKGIQTKDKDKREKLLKNALAAYEKEKAGEVYPQAAFALGEYYLSQSDWKNAAEYYSKLNRDDAQYIEASFKAATCYWQLNDLAHALAAIVPLTVDSPLTSVYNNAGAISLQAARDEKDAAVRQQLLEQAVKLLKRGADYSTDATVRFNYAYALFLAGQFAEAAKQWPQVLAESSGDGRAYFLYAKSLEQTQQPEKAAANDDQAKRYMGGEYARWQQEWTQSHTTSTVPVILQAYNRDQVLQVRIRDSAAAERSDTETQDLLVKARELYKEGLDDEALSELRRSLTVEPMNAEAYLLIGLIQQRQANQDQAISALKTALFWNSKLAAAHIMLGRIFLQRKDCQQALAYSSRALDIDGNNPEALALQRSIATEGCR